MQGRIACANVLSDLYAMGVSHCDTLLMILAICQDMKEEERQVVTNQIIQGMNDTCDEAKTKITGGQTVINPYPITGGIASTVVDHDEFITPKHARPGDVLVLTKPLGTAIAASVNIWMKDDERRQKVLEILSEEEVEYGYALANDSMSRLNRHAASLMLKYNSRGATDVTGFGLLGHAQNLASAQERSVNFNIHSIPIIKNLLKLEGLFNKFNILQGRSAETSGGLLTILPKDRAEDYIAEIESLDDRPAWIIGEVTEGDNNAIILEDATAIEADA
eukprot:CAMPEP_0115036504 /NCGR_PEP_ID=MMETSP0216-20121206/42169_1 /TAXON_ID=223996 /ORGANISM="Protocruzia adherens, Strain Boccale" /LENGTH=276 /DNA_ID=CAMNT_0002416359 /DNA_START=366 /DNA_END=1196 /DNA_ORIENTATION=-